MPNRVSARVIPAAHHMTAAHRCPTQYSRPPSSLRLRDHLNNKHDAAHVAHRIPNPLRAAKKKKKKKKKPNDTCLLGEEDLFPRGGRGARGMANKRKRLQDGDDEGDDEGDNEGEGEGGGTAGDSATASSSATASDEFGLGCMGGVEGMGDAEGGGGRVNKKRPRADSEKEDEDGRKASSADQASSTDATKKVEVAVVVSGVVDTVEAMEAVEVATVAEVAVAVEEVVDAPSKKKRKYKKGLKQRLERRVDFRDGQCYTKAQFGDKYKVDFNSL